MNPAGNSPCTALKRKDGGIAWIAISLMLGLLLTGSASGASARQMLDAKFPRIQFDDVQLADVIDYLRDATRVNFYIDWKSLEAVGVTRQTPVTLKLHAMPMRTALTFILRSAGGVNPLSWRLDQNVIQIASRPAADLVLVRRVYPVQDLLLVVPDFVGPNFDLSSVSQNTSGGNGGGGNSGTLFGNTNGQDQEKPITRRERAEELIRLITDNIRPEIWKANGGPASINYFNGHLIVIAPADVQEKIGGR